MENSSSLVAGLIFVGLFFLFIAVPVALIAYFGFRMITKLGQFPSKTPAIQLSVFWQLVIIEIVAVVLIMTFYQMLAETKGEKVRGPATEIHSFI